MINEKDIQTYETTDETTPSDTVVVIPNISYEFPYTPDIKSIKIVTETADGEVIAVNTIPESVIEELTRIDNIVIPDVQYEIPYSADLEQIKIVTSLADDTVIGVNNIIKKSVYEPLRTGSIELKIDGSDVVINRVTIEEIIPNSDTGQILYKIEGITEGYLNKTDLEALINADDITLKNGTLLQYRISTTDNYTSPEITSINLEYSVTEKTYTTVTSPRNLTHMINKLEGQINGVTHVSGNNLITNKATIQNYRVMLGSDDIVLRHIDDAYGYRKVDISIEEDGYVTPLEDTSGITIIKAERKNTVIKSTNPINKYARISITIPKN